MNTKDQTKRAQGSRFEELAQSYLEAKGYEILGRNLHYGFGELDLVAHEVLANQKILVFVEVRKRDRRSYLEPEETLTFAKQRSLRLSIERYLSRYRGPAKSLRIDLIAFHDESLVHRPHFMSL